MSGDSGVLVRPKYRGTSHRAAALIGIPAFLILGIMANSTTERLAVLLQAIGVVAMLGVSGIYHSGKLSPAANRIIKRVDHATILLAIGGTYAAITLLSLTGDHRTKMLLVVGIGTLLGIIIRMAWLDAPYPVIAVVYVVVGWSAVVDFAAYIDGTTTIEFALVVLGGVLYTTGAVIYALHRPKLKPEIFGYHELFHAFVVAGAVCHFAATALLLS